ncbi:MFS transporter [Metabacillus idriensis]|uniref:MFS transporter n=1 Tax=Metabacillus idriensis TaxID=324768 RepID=UPI00203CFF09|nr:MFS transporter [Metabacillus idriensis]MCM3594190.1 MFS transporter [Metabacillus idriensis]
MSKLERISRPRGKNTRWAISSLLSSLIILNYFDRVAIAVAAPELQQSFALTAFEIGLVFTIYNYAYTLMQLPIGGMLDKWGVAWVTRIGMILWTILTLSIVFIQGKFLLYFLRFLTGITSASAFPAASKATANWFPFHERGLANALFDSSAKLSNVIGAPLVAILITLYDWRVAFLTIGVINVIFTIIFWKYYDEPGSHKRISKDEINYIQTYGDSTDVPSYKALAVLKSFFKNRKVWGLMIGFTGYGYTFNLLLLWLPTFFQEQFELDLLSSSLYTAIPWLIAAMAGILAGGFLVDHLIGKGYSPNKVYKGIVVVGLTIGLAFIGSIFTDNPVLSMIFISIGLAGISATAPIGWTIAARISPPGTTAILSSMVNFTNNLFGGIVATLLTGYIVDATGSFNLAFVIAAIVLLVGLFFYTVVLGDIEQISLEKQ